MKIYSYVSVWGSDVAKIKMMYDIIQVLPHLYQDLDGPRFQGGS